MSGQEPTEHVSCGRCSCVNSVPFGLDVFKCYKCGVAVVISRESSAACAAASPTALYLDGLQAPSSAPSSSSKSSRSFFEKLQRQVDKTLQKVEQSFFDGSSAAAAPAKTLPVGKPLESEAAGYAQSQVSYTVFVVPGRIRIGTDCSVNLGFGKLYALPRRGPRMRS
ncbi:unnamed protein product [Effrenium voratum]|nr:unnamed protein product [Effrenium voratum]